MISFVQKLEFANSYTRLPILLESQTSARSKYFREWLTALGSEWESIDNVSVFKRELSKALLAAQERGLCHLLMTEAERMVVEHLPENFTVYRGCYERNQDGLSWTLCKKTAQTFPTLNRYRKDGQTPLLLERTISKYEVIAFKGARQEQEIILLSKSTSQHRRTS